MKWTLKIEELCFALSCLGILYFLKVEWWWYLLFLLGPDISFLGYSFGTRVGAFTYNLFHHKAVALGIMALGYFLNNQTLLVIGLVVLGHSSMDRFFGYGLKLSEGFKFTHLGQIGNK
jgi:Domain of unknown function (DUF4260)